MDRFDDERRIALVEAVAAVPGADGGPVASLFRHGSLEVEYYAPRGEDLQEPHSRDEVYVIASGRAVYTVEGQRMDVGPGDVCFAAAGEVHRFEDLSDDFGTWVVFYGPEGGEASDE